MQTWKKWEQKADLILMKKLCICSVAVCSLKLAEASPLSTPPLWYHEKHHCSLELDLVITT